MGWRFAFTRLPLLALVLIVLFWIKSRAEVILFPHDNVVLLGLVLVWCYQLYRRRRKAAAREICSPQTPANVLGNGGRSSSSSSRCGKIVLTLAMLIAVLVAGWVLLKQGLNYWLLDKFSQNQLKGKDQWVMIRTLFGLNWRLMQLHKVKNPKTIPASNNDYFDYVGFILWCH